jgi:hypothetical protein
MPYRYLACAWCGQQFAAASPRAKYCDSTCRAKANRLFIPPSMRGRLKQKPGAAPASPSILLSLLSGKPDTGHTVALPTCKTCRQKLPPDSPFNYCSPACRQTMLMYLKKLRPAALFKRRKRKWIKKKSSHIPVTKPYYQPPLNETRILQVSTEIQEEIARIYWEIGQELADPTPTPAAPRAPLFEEE